MAHGQVGELGVVDPDFKDVSARRVQEPVAHHCPDRTGRDHRLRDEAVDGAKDDRLIDGRVRHDCQRRIDRKMPNEYGEPAKHHALQLGEEPVTPIQRGLQSLLARRRGALVQPTARSGVGRASAAVCCSP